MIKHYSLIAKQGRPFLVLAVLIFAVLAYHYGWQASLPALLLPFAVIYMFRDPQRSVPSDPYGIISPVDGRITSIESVHDHYLDRDAVRLRLRMNLLGVYTTRSPIEGKIMQQWYITDKAQLRAGDPAFVQWIQTDEGEDLIVAVYRAPWCVTLIAVYKPVSGGQGQRCGFVSFGTQIELFLPADARLHVEAGQGIISGVTLLADFTGH